MVKYGIINGNYQLSVDNLIGNIPSRINLLMREGNNLRGVKERKNYEFSKCNWKTNKRSRIE